ncbi:MAG: hypothetical protein K2Y10_11960 [Burkholderiaceae bacterium]|nr:hypothetical protein [Burkholderiaceae bacterium]
MATDQKRFFVDSLLQSFYPEENCNALDEIDKSKLWQLQKSMKAVLLVVRWYKLLMVVITNPKDWCFTSY